jgi:uncharacterized protein (TIGR02466 family)
MQLFATQVYYNKLSSVKGHRLSRNWIPELIQEAYKIQTHDVVGLKWCSKNYPGGYTSYGSLNQLHLFSSSFAALKPLMDLHVKQYLADLSYDVSKQSVNLSNFWLNIMGKNVVHTGHIHPQSLISGTIYLQSDLQSSSLKFEDPRLGFFMAAPLQKKSTPETQQRFYFLKPQSGNIVLFESLLRHEVPPNKSSKDRISISFNYEWSHR